MEVRVSLVFAGCANMKRLITYTLNIKKPSFRLGYSILTLIEEGFVVELTRFLQIPPKSLFFALRIFQVTEEIAFWINHNQVILTAKALAIGIKTASKGIEFCVFTVSCCVD